MTGNHNSQLDTPCDSSLPLQHPKLTMPHSVRHAGRLVFPEYPKLIIKLPATAVNVLVTLFVAWARTRHLPPDDRGWVNGRSAHATYQEQMRQKLSIGAVSKYMTRLMTRLRKEFEDRGVEPPGLIERDDRGTHLTRRIIIEDLTGEWKAPGGARNEASSSGPAWPTRLGQQLNAQH